MSFKQLEFRGIPLHHLQMYFEELGGTKMTGDEFPIIYTGDGWSGQIISEKEIAFTASFVVNAVHIHFIAEDDERLAEIIKLYRYKTTRIGG